VAGEWLKVELALPDKPEVHYIANALKLDPDAVVGKLFRVWAWFDQHTENGDALGVTFALLDRITGVTGFGEAMMLAGWMEQRDKVLHMPKFDSHTSQSSKKRALTAKRMAKLRNAPVTPPASQARHLEKRREEVNPKPKAQHFVPPPWVDLEAWKGFENMRAKIRKPLTDRARAMIVKELEALKAQGHNPVAVLAQSEVHAWAGVFPVKVNGSAKSPSQWWTSDEGVLAKGKELLLEPKMGESMPSFKTRINAAIERETV